MQEARDEEEREEQLMEVERASSQKISDRDHARHMNKTAKGARPPQRRHRRRRKRRAERSEQSGLASRCVEGRGMALRGIASAHGLWS